MASVSTLAPARDGHDPWGFGLTAADDVVCIDRLQPLDEVADPADVAAAFPGARPWRAALVPVPASESAFDPAPLADAAPAVAAGPASPRPASVLRLPFSPERAGVMALFASVIIAQAFYIGVSLTAEATARPGVGQAVLSSHPSGAKVTVDGTDYGVTPLVATLDAGTHRVEVAGADGARAALSLRIQPGEHVTHHVALTAPVAAPAAAPATGALRVDTAGAAAQVFVDDVLVGAAPAQREELSVGTHQVTVQFASGKRLQRTVAVTAGERVALLAEAPIAAAVPAAVATGTLRVQAPFDVQVFAGERLVGTNAAPVSLPAGTHTLTLVNTALGFSQTISTRVAARKTATLAADVPLVPVQLNALPWAEVTVDGRALGETPLANVPLPLGTHRVMFRHPEFGEQVESLTVRAGGPVRLVADLRRTR